MTLGRRRAGGKGMGMGMPVGEETGGMRGGDCTSPVNEVRTS